MIITIIVIIFLHPASAGSVACVGKSKSFNEPCASARASFIPTVSPSRASTKVRKHFFQRFICGPGPASKEISPTKSNYNLMRIYSSHSSVWWAPFKRTENEISFFSSLSSLVARVEFTFDTLLPFAIDQMKHEYTQYTHTHTMKIKTCTQFL